MSSSCSLNALCLSCLMMSHCVRLYGKRISFHDVVARQTNRHHHDNCSSYYLKYFWLYSTNNQTLDFRVLTEIVLVNEIVGGAETAGYLLKYDSVHGTWWDGIEIWMLCMTHEGFVFTEENLFPNVSIRRPAEMRPIVDDHQCSCFTLSPGCGYSSSGNTDNIWKQFSAPRNLYRLVHPVDELYSSFELKS